LEEEQDVRKERESIWMDYDPEGDVLYINFEGPLATNETNLEDEGVIVRLNLKEGRLVGLVILNAQKRFSTVAQAMWGKKGKA